MKDAEFATIATPAGVRQSGPVRKTARCYTARCVQGEPLNAIFGPNARLIIQPFLVGRALDACLFSPAEAERERREAASAKRKTRPWQGNSPGSNRSKNPKRKVGDHYTAAAYRRTIEWGH